MLLSRSARARAFWVVLWRETVAAAAIAASGAFAEPLVRAAGAQGSRLYETSELPRSHNRAFSEHYAATSRLLNGIEYARGVLNEALWTEPDAAVSRVETTEFARLANNVLRSPPRLRPQMAAVLGSYSHVAPRVEAILSWSRMFGRQLYDIWADESIPKAEKDGYVLELLGHYRSRPDLALSSSPKRMALLDGRLYSFSFRQRYPKFNGMSWGFTWLEQGLYESLLTAENEAERRAQVDSVVRRFWQMLGNVPESTPFLLPRISAVAPTFATRYPEAGAILDNMQLLQNLIADILVSPEIPRAAKGREIELVAGLFRSDTAQSMAYDEWLQQDQRMGLENMGGPAVGFSASLPKPTVVRGASMAAVSSANQAPAGGDMPGMDHGAMTVQQDSGRAARLAAIQQRMFADPVIRERVATDPVLQRLLAEAGISVASGATAPVATGMDHANMPGMQQGAVKPAVDSGMIMGLGGANVSAEDRRRAVEFIVRLLSDPAVEGRIHADPELHRLWSDPDVQRRLAELRRVPAPPNERGAVLKPKPPRQPLHRQAP